MRGWGGQKMEKQEKENLRQRRRKRAGERGGRGGGGDGVIKINQTIDRVMSARLSISLFHAKPRS